VSYQRDVEDLFFPEFLVYIIKDRLRETDLQVNISGLDKTKNI
jgi:hypothetical protein